MNDSGNELCRYIDVSNREDIKGVPPVVHFTIQSDPIGKVGINGCQARDMLEYIIHLFESLDASYPCGENKATIIRLQNALSWQDERTKERKERNVEGKNLV